MPELVEVFVLVDKINREFKNSILQNIVINSGQYFRKHKPVGYDEMIKKLPLKIISFDTRGKFIYIRLEGGYSIWITLGLTGELLLSPDKHSHVTFETDDGNFYFDDPRNFGKIKFVFTEKELDKKLKTLGHDPLKEDVTYEDFLKLLRKKQDKLIMMVLVDQKVISGIGNYLRAEILYHAKISPFRKVKDLSDEDIKAIWKSMNLVISNSFKTQMKDGLHTYKFAVYGKKMTSSGEEVKNVKDKSDRTIWYVPSVQI